MKQLPAPAAPGGAGDRRPRRCSRPAAATATTTARQAVTAAAAASRSRSAPTSPIPPFEESASQPEFTGFDIELIEAIAEKIGRNVEFTGHLVRHDLPRPRPGQVRNGRLGDDDHRRTREDGRLHQPVLPASEQSILVAEGTTRHQIGEGPRRQDRRRPAGDDRARNTSKKRPTRAKSAPSRRARTRSPALKAGTVDAVVIDRPVAEGCGREDERHRNRGGDRDRRTVRIRRSPQDDEELLDELNEGARSEVIGRRRPYETIYKKWFHKPARRSRSATATHEPS